VGLLSRSQLLAKRYHRSGAGLAGNKARLARHEIGPNRVRGRRWSGVGMRRMGRRSDGRLLGNTLKDE
jgi:hypothetical protein